MLWTSWGLKWPSGSKEKKAVLCQQCIFNTVCSYFFDWSFPWTNQNPHSHKVALCQCRLKLVQEIFKKWLMYLYHFTITPVSPFGKKWIPFVQCCFVSGLVEIKWLWRGQNCEKFTDTQTDGRWTTCDKKKLIWVFTKCEPK